jgi:hypothetical protein
MKRTGRCPKCDGDRIGYLPSLPDVGRSDHTEPQLYARTIVTFREQGDFAVRLRGHGVIEAYVCGSCGYIEEYVVAVRSVPFEALPGFRWLPRGDSAYR